MDIFGKDEREDLSADQKKVLKGLAASYKQAAIQASEAFRRGAK